MIQVMSTTTNKKTYMMQVSSTSTNKLGPHPPHRYQFYMNHSMEMQTPKYDHKIGVPSTMSIV